MKSALSTKAANKEIIVLDELTLDEIKTKRMVNVLNNPDASKNTVLVVIKTTDENVVRSARNIPGVKTAYVNTLNVYDIIRYEKFVVTLEAVSGIEEVYV